MKIEPSPPNGKRSRNAFFVSIILLGVAAGVAYYSTILETFSASDNVSENNGDSEANREDAANLAISEQRTRPRSVDSFSISQNSQDHSLKRSELDASSENAEELISAYTKWSAQSLEEARWLERHGFPSLDEEADFSSESEAMLQKLAGNGNLVAQVYLGEKIANDPERRSEGLAILSDAAARGSVRAWSARGEVMGDMMNNSFSCRDPNAAASFLVAALLGDGGAVLGFQMCTRGLSGDGQAQVILLASNMFAQMRLEQEERFGGRNVYQPRPRIFGD